MDLTLLSLSINVFEFEFEFPITLFSQQTCPSRQLSGGQGDRAMVPFGCQGLSRPNTLTCFGSFKTQQ